MRLTRHDYDVLAQAARDSYYPAVQCFEGQADKLIRAQVVTDTGGALQLTDYGKSQLERVRGGTPAKLSASDVVLPRRISYQTLARFGLRPHTWRALCLELGRDSL